MEKKEIKRMHHLFTCVGKRELTEAEHLYSIFLSSRKAEEVVQIPDCCILNNPSFLTGFAAFWDSLDKTAEGLSYHGMTVIPQESLRAFQQRVENDPNHQDLSALIDLCSMAMDREQEILHWGM